MSHQKTVYLIDDDAGDRHYLAFRLGAVNVEAWPFSSGASFLASVGNLTPQVVLIGVDAEPHRGLETMAELARREIDWPVIALSRGKDLGVAVEAMKLGALDFLPKPADEDRLMAALATASAILDDRVRASEARRAAQARVTALTAREIGISLALLSGRPNKIVAYQMGISVRTVEAHRANVMMKLGVRSLAEVFTLLTSAGLAPAAGDAPQANVAALRMPARPGPAQWRAIQAELEFSEPRAA